MSRNEFARGKKLFSTAAVQIDERAGGGAGSGSREGAFCLGTSEPPRGLCSPSTRTPLSPSPFPFKLHALFKGTSYGLGFNDHPSGGRRLFFFFCAAVRFLVEPLQPNSAIQADLDTLSAYSET